MSDTAVGLTLNLVHSSIHQPKWRAHVNPVMAPSLNTATRQAVPVQFLIPLHVCIEDPRARAWYCITEKLEVYVILGILFINMYISSIFPNHCMVLLINSRLIAIFRCLPKLMTAIIEDVQDEGMQRVWESSSYFPVMYDVLKQYVYSGSALIG